MKSLFGNNKSDFNVAGFEFLSENEMQAIRGGAEPIKPTARPKDAIEFVEE